MLLPACSRREADRAAAPPSPPAAGPDSGDLAAYERGVRREIRLTEAALRLLECSPSAEQRAAVTVLSGSGQIVTAGARAAGLDSVPYELLLERVDSQLRERAPADLAGGRVLDSLRVRLVVLRTRLASEAAQRVDTRVRQVVRPPC